MNSYRGLVPINVGGWQHHVRYDWSAIARLKDEIGADFDVAINRAAFELDLRLIAKALSIGMADKMTAEEIFEASPPITPSLDAIRRALNIAFRGTEEAPVESETGPRRIRAAIARTTSWLSFGRRPSAPASATPNSGR